MDTLENRNEYPPEETAFLRQSAVNDTPVPEAAPPVEPVAAPQPAPQANPYWSTPGDVQAAPPKPEYYPPQPHAPAPQPEYTYYQHREPVARPTYYPPQRPASQPWSQPSGNYQRPVYAQPGTPQNAYVPPRPAAPVPPVPGTRKKGGVWKHILAAVLILCLVAGSCSVTALCVNNYWEERTAAMTTSYNNQINQLWDRINSDAAASGSQTASGSYAPTGDALTPAQVYTRNVQAVVAISSTITTSYYGQTAESVGTGSGFIVTSDGYVVTNYHVVEDANSITVTTNSGSEYRATLVGYDSTNDVAVLKVEADNLPCVTMGSSSSLIVGDQVVAIGNPLGELTNTLTVGYISAKDRMVTTDGFGINMLQTDAAINSGNSGGPLFNMYGQVVGITSAKYSGESSSGATIEGIGFAIPIDDVLDLIEALISDGYVSSGYLGVSVSDYDPSYAAYYGLSENTPAGAIVREVVTGYCAARAGIQTGDVIVAVGEYTVNGVTSLGRALRYYVAGDTTTITVYRDGQQINLTITLDERPADLDTQATESTQSTFPDFSGGKP